MIIRFRGVSRVGKDITVWKEDWPVYGYDQIIGRRLEVDIRGFYVTGGGKRCFTSALQQGVMDPLSQRTLEDNVRRDPSDSLRL